MVLDLLWGLLSTLLIGPLLGLLPTVITEASQWDALMTVLVISNRVVDVRIIFTVIGTTMVVFSICGPAAIASKIYKLIRG